jgi:DNA-binding LytR/AlgR family response regulator
VVFDEVLYLEGMENYVIIHTATKKLITHSTLKSLIEKLPKQAFLQTHKSYIVAINKIGAVEGNILHIGNHQVPISRQLRDQVLGRII